MFQPTESELAMSARMLTHNANYGCVCKEPGGHLPLFEIARVLVRFDHVARFIVNADHGFV
jgi:hypothetical protein